MNIDRFVAALFLKLNERLTAERPNTGSAPSTTTAERQFCSWNSRGRPTSCSLDASSSG
jgi:hypothetical protein